jgi:ATP-dependent DNA ligase
VVGWTDPEGARPWLGALLLAYYDPDGRLVYAGRAGTGIDHAELERLWRRLQPLATPEMYSKGRLFLVTNIQLPMVDE